MLFQLQFPELVGDLEKKVKILKTAVEEVQDSGPLKKILETALLVGNKLNSHASDGSGAVKAFRLHSLLQFATVRHYCRKRGRGSYALLRTCECPL